MRIFRRLLNRPYKFSINRLGKGDFRATFRDEFGFKYVVDFEWYNGSMDIEFYVVGFKHDTTNLHCQYKVMQTIVLIHKKLISDYAYFLDRITFGVSGLRNGNFDYRSIDIRINFFIKYVKRLYPDSTIHVESGFGDVLVILT